MRSAIGMGITAAVAALLLIGAPAALAEPESPEVLCTTQLTEPSAPGRAEYTRRPHFCDLHQRGKLPVDAIDTYEIGRMRWRTWSPAAAVGVGALAISSIGAVPAHVRLFAPATACSPAVSVFTEARVKYFEPHLRPRAFTIPLDRCLS